MGRTGGDAPIFVIGFQRSGTTLIQALLGAHPRIAAPPETFFTYRIADFADYFGDLSDPANLERALYEALHPPVDLFADCGFEMDAVLARARAGPPTYAGLLDAIMTDFAERQGKPRWSEKSPGQAIDTVYRLFPDAQVVHIVRDPRDMIASSLASPFNDLDAAQLARGWLRLTLRTIRRGSEAGPSRFFQIRYEDLTREPETVLRELCAFLGEGYDDAMVDDPARRRVTVPAVAHGWQARALEPVAAPRDGSWKRRIGRRDRLRVHAILDGLPTAFGYEAPSRRDRLLSTPFAAADIIRRAAKPIRRAAPPPAPEQRYTAAQAHMHRQRDRVHAAQPRLGSRDATAMRCRRDPLPR